LIVSEYTSESDAVGVPPPTNFLPMLKLARRLTNNIELLIPTKIVFACLLVTSVPRALPIEDPLTQEHQQGRGSSQFHGLLHSLVGN
jgi:hypothetical protein